MTDSSSMTFNELNLLNGKNFISFWAGTNLSPGEISFLVMRTTTNDIIVREAEITGSSDLVSWTYYNETVFDDQTGTIVDEIRLNPTFNIITGVEVFHNPVISDIGTPLTPVDVDVRAIPSATGEAIMESVILKNDVFIPKGTSQCIKIINRQVAGDRNIELTIPYSLFK